MLRDLRAPRNDRLCIASYQATTRLFQIPRINSFQFPVLLHMLNDSAFVRRVTCWARNHRPSEPAKSHCLQLQGSKFPLPQSLHVRLQSGIYTVSTSSTAQRTPWIGSTNAMDGCCRCSSPTHPPTRPAINHSRWRSITTSIRFPRHLCSVRDIWGLGILPTPESCKCNSLSEDKCAFPPPSPSRNSLSDSRAAGPGRHVISRVPQPPGFSRPQRSDLPSASKTGPAV